jgi:predicted SAM-dependent methyltransferase
MVKPGGSGAGADDHKLLYNYKTIAEMLTQAGFKVKYQEYFDENGVFHAENWDNQAGFINRSIRYDRRNVGGQPVYTSLMVDGIKE